MEILECLVSKMSLHLSKKDFNYVVTELCPKRFYVFDVDSEDVLDYIKYAHGKELSEYQVDCFKDAWYESGGIPKFSSIKN